MYCTYCCIGPKVVQYLKFYSTCSCTLSAVVQYLQLYSTCSYTVPSGVQYVQLYSTSYSAHLQDQPSDLSADGIQEPGGGDGQPHLGSHNVAQDQGTINTKGCWNFINCSKENLLNVWICLLVELHQEGSAPAVCSAPLCLVCTHPFLPAEASSDIQNALGLKLSLDLDFSEQSRVSPAECFGLRHLELEPVWYTHGKYNLGW